MDWKERKQNRLRLPDETADFLVAIGPRKIIYEETYRLVKGSPK